MHMNGISHEGTGNLPLGYSKEGIPAHSLKTLGTASEADARVEVHKHSLINPYRSHRRFHGMNNVLWVKYTTLWAAFSIAHGTVPGARNDVVPCSGVIN
jgi:hypothetical protein